MNWLGSLQQLGRAVMLPTMVLPAAAILLSLGSLPWSTWGFPMVSDMANAAGHGIFIFCHIYLRLVLPWVCRIRQVRRDWQHWLVWLYTIRSH